MTFNGRESTGELFLIESNHLGLAHRVIDSEGSTVWRATFDSYGRLLSEDMPLNYTLHGDSQSREFEYNLHFPGQYHDKESDLHYTPIVLRRLFRSLHQP